MKKKHKGVIIANPIYDVVFKNLMTTSKGTIKDIAAYFVGTILGEEITDITFLDKEVPYFKVQKKKVGGKEVTEKLALIRLDFIATIRTKSGIYKKVLIEIQQSKKPTDMLRFRTYLGEQYRLEDTITVNDEQITQALPVIAIYMLGFKLPGIDTIIVKVDRKYMDLIGHVEIRNKSPFIESLTHDGYFIQIPRIKNEAYPEWDACSELKQMLSLFEQDNFVDEDFFKEYKYPITNKNIKKMVETLTYLTLDPIIRRSMQEEYWANRNEEIWESQLAAKEKELAANKKVLAAKDKVLAANKKDLAAKKKDLAAKNKDLAANKKDLAAKDVKISSLSSDNERLRQLLQQAGIDIS